MTTELFNYPEDREELFSPPDEKEAFLYHTLSNFEDLITEYGPDYILNKIRYPIYTKLYNYFDLLE